MTFAVLPAAGKSTRMGRPKLSLPLGGRTVLEQVIRTLHAADVARVLVVVGPHVRELVLPAEQAGAQVLQLEEETPDMRATVQAGLAWLEERFRPSPDAPWLLVPADHPVLEAAVIRRLLAALAQQPTRSIVVPTYRGQRGHPAVLRWLHVPAIRAFPPGQGLNAYLRQQANQTLELAVEEPGVLLDLDTPADYERLRRQQPWGRAGSLSAGGQTEEPNAHVEEAGHDVGTPYHLGPDL